MIVYLVRRLRRRRQEDFGGKKILGQEDSEMFLPSNLFAPAVFLTAGAAGSGLATKAESDETPSPATHEDAQRRNFTSLLFVTLVPLRG